MSDPKNMFTLPFDRAAYPAKKGAVCKPAELQGQKSCKLHQYGKKSFYIRIFFKRGHSSHSVKNTVVPFAKRSILRAYLGYSQVLPFQTHPGVLLIDPEMDIPPCPSLKFPFFC
jgi:hypothetical protein